MVDSAGDVTTEDGGVTTTADCDRTTADKGGDRMLDDCGCDCDIGTGVLKGGVTVVAVDRLGVTTGGFTVTGGGDGDTHGDTGVSNAGDKLIIGDGVDGVTTADCDKPETTADKDGDRMLDDCGGCDCDIGTGKSEAGTTVVAVDRLGVMTNGVTVTDGGDGDTQGDTGVTNAGDKLEFANGAGAATLSGDSGETTDGDKLLEGLGAVGDGVVIDGDRRDQLECNRTIGDCTGNGSNPLGSGSNPAGVGNKPAVELTGNVGR
jgi:hypothetical protein